MGFYTVLLVIHTIIVLFLIMMVLIQRTDSDGMGGLGGGGGNQFLTGRSQANLLTRTTAILAVSFMVTSLWLAILASDITKRSIIDSTVPLEDTAPADVDTDTLKDKADELEKKAPPAAKAAKEKAPEKKPEKSEKPAAETPAVPKPE